MSQPVRRAARRGAVIALLAASLVISAAVGAQAATGPSVALGDSYTSAPLVPNPTGNPVLCGRSTNNYPHDVKRAISPLSFTDASCSGATTTDMTQPQSLEGGLQTARRLPGVRRLGQRNHPHLGRLPPAPQSGGRSQHGQAGRR